MIIEDVKAKMKEKNITQEKMSEKMYVTPVTMHKWLSGKVRVKVEDLVRIADYLGCDIVLVEREKDE